MPTKLITIRLDFDTLAKLDFILNKAGDGEHIPCNRSEFIRWTVNEMYPKAVDHYDKTSKQEITNNVRMAKQGNKYAQQYLKEAGIKWS